MLYPVNPHLRGWRWILTDSMPSQVKVPTLELQHVNPKMRRRCGSATIWLTGSHNWFVWDEMGTGGANCTGAPQSIDMLMREAEDAFVKSGWHKPQRK